jgi:transposase
MDLRVRVLADCDAGMGTSAVASKYSVSPAWVRRLKQRRAAGRGIEPQKGRPGPKPGLAAGTPGGGRLAELAAAAPDLSAAEFRDRLGLACHATTVWRALRRLGLTFKKKSKSPRSGPAPTWPPAGRRGAAR